MATTLEKIKAIAADGSRSLAERQAEIRKIDPTAARMFALTNASPLARESREADERAETQAAEAAEQRRIDQLPMPELDVYETLRKTDSVGAALYHKAHAPLINAQRDERRAIEAALNPEPPRAA